MAGEESERRVIASNRKARYEYEVLDRFEAGISLLGPEVKSLRAGKTNLSHTYAAIRRRIHARSASAAAAARTPVTTGIATIVALAHRAKTAVVVVPGGTAA